MMHVYYCMKCKKYRYTNNVKRAQCCNTTMHCIDIEFTDFVKMSLEERASFFGKYERKNK